MAATLAGATAVMLGAFGAHALKEILTTHQLSIWEKGVQYQMYHALVLLGCYLYLKNEPAKLVRNAAICFITGIICFSGSLYLLATNEYLHIPSVVLGPVTPIGGLFFISGWVLLFFQAVKKPAALNR